jgi:phage baseplate assembly protein W
MLKIGDLVAPVNTVKPGYRYRVRSFPKRKCAIASHDHFRMVEIVVETPQGDRVMPSYFCESILTPIDRT